MSRISFFICSDESCNRQSLLMNICHFPHSHIFIDSDFIEVELPQHSSLQCICRNLLKKQSAFSLCYICRPVSTLFDYQEMNQHQHRKWKSRRIQMVNYLLVFAVMTHSLIRLFDIVAHCMTNHFNDSPSKI